jgi:hypothetical protein
VLPDDLKEIFPRPVLIERAHGHLVASNGRSAAQDQFSLSAWCPGTS